MVSGTDGKPMGSRGEQEADRKQKSLRIARVDPIARRAALLLGRQHGSEAEPRSMPSRISAPLLVAIALSGVGIGGMDPAQGQPSRGGVGGPASGAGSSLPVNPLGMALWKQSRLRPAGPTRSRSWLSSSRPICRARLVLPAYRGPNSATAAKSSTCRRSAGACSR